MKKTSKQLLVEHLEAAGFMAFEDDIVIKRGPKIKEDIIQCWALNGLDSKGVKCEISSLYTLTQLRRGIMVRKATSRDQIYGDYIVEPIPNQRPHPIRDVGAAWKRACVKTTVRIAAKPIANAMKPMPDNTVSCSDIQWEIAVAMTPESNVPYQRINQAWRLIKECEESHLEGDCEICRAEG